MRLRASFAVFELSGDEDRRSEHNGGKRQRKGRVEGFAEHEDSDRDREDGIQELTEPEEIEREILSGVGKGDHRNQSDDARAGERERNDGIIRTESRETVEVKYREISKREREHQNAFESVACPRTQRNELLERPIEGPGRGNADRDPGNCAVIEGKNGNPRSRKKKRDAPQARKPLAEKEAADRNREERRQKHADAEFDHAVDMRGKNVYPPVDAGRSGGRGKDQKKPAVRSDLAEGRRKLPLSAECEQEHKQNKKRPDDAMGDHLPASRRREKRPVHRHEAPAKVCETGSEETSGTVLRCRHKKK